MVTRDDCMTLLLGRFPGFQGRWEAHQASWAEETPGLCLDVAQFGRYIAELIQRQEVTDLPAIFATIEELMVDGDDEVQTAVATCLLENLLNYTSAGDIPASSFVHLLGPASRDYCRAWDEFTGVATEGL